MDSRLVDIAEDILINGIPMNLFNPDDLTITIRFHGDTYHFKVQHLGPLKAMNVPMENRAYEPDFPEMAMRNLASHPLCLLTWHNGEWQVVTIQHKLATDLCRKYYNFHLDVYIPELNKILQALSNEPDHLTDDQYDKIYHDVYGLHPRHDPILDACSPSVPRIKL